VSTPLVVGRLAGDELGPLPISADAPEGRYRLIDAAYERRSLARSNLTPPSRTSRPGENVLHSVQPLPRSG
jgi:hypothetical protein